MSSETGPCTRLKKSYTHTLFCVCARVCVRPYVVNCPIMGSNQIIAALVTKLWTLCCIPSLQWSYCLDIKTRGCYKVSERWREREKEEERERVAKR